MGKTSRALGLAVFIVSLIASHPSAAQQILLDPEAWTTTAGLSATVGYSFTVGATDWNVEAMGYFERGTNGLFGSYPMAIWDSSGTQVAAATVPSGDTAPQIGDYVYVNLPMPVILLSGQTYVVGAKVNPDDSFIEEGTANINDATFVNMALYDNSQPGFVEPTSVGVGNFYEVNLRNSTVTAVPEPGSYGLGIEALAVGLLYVRRKSRA